MDIKSKSFWIATIAVPLVMIIFGVFIGFMAEDSKSLQAWTSPTQPDADGLTPLKIAGMVVGMMLTLFIMIYGAQIFNKVKTEKCNRIMEILATCVDGRTMMFAKIISVGLIGITQFLVWVAICIALISWAAWVFVFQFPYELLLNPQTYAVIGWGLLYFIGGYVFFGSLYAAFGAMSDKNQENQEYMTLLTFVLLGSFYIGQYAVDHSDASMVTWCSFIPFTASTVGAVNAISGEVPLWQNLLSVVSLYVCAALGLSLSGKLYKSTLLLKGKKLSPRDIITIIKDVR